jgi:Family of unknown function (DUF6132)
MLQKTSKYKLTIFGVVSGALLGYLYYFFIGCDSGHCMITSRPLNSSIYGGLMGGLIFDSIRTIKPSQKTKLEKNE